MGSPARGDRLSALETMHGSRQSFKSVKEAESVINTRLGFMLAVALYTSRPAWLKFIPSCLGIKLHNEEEVSLKTWKWLHGAGVSLSRHAARRAVERLQSQPQGAEGSQIEASEGGQLPTSVEQTDKPATAVSDNGNIPDIKPDRRKYFCLHCPQRFFRKSELMSHRLKHVVVKPYVCKDCHSAYKIPSALKNHKCRGPRPTGQTSPAPTQQTGQSVQIQREVDAEETAESEKTTFSRLFEADAVKPKVPVPCTKCSKIFSTRGTLARHMSRVHNAQRPFMCPVCERTFQLEEVCRNHVTQTHDEAMSIAESIGNHSWTFPCTKCDKIFHYKKGLLDHLRLHCPNAHKRFICPVCQKSFVQKSSCQKHQATCVQVSKKTTQPVTGSSQPEKKTFLCKTCGCVLGSSSGLSYHERHVHAAHLYTCSVCDRRFKTEEGCAKHKCHTRTSNVPGISSKKSNKGAKKKTENVDRLTENVEGSSPVDGQPSEMSVSSSTKKNYKGKRKRPMKMPNVQNEIEIASTNLEMMGLPDWPQPSEMSVSSSTKKNYKGKRKRPMKTANVQNEIEVASANLEVTGLTDLAESQETSSPKKKQCLVEPTIQTDSENDPYQLLPQPDDLGSSPSLSVIISDVEPGDAENVRVMTVDETIQIDV